MYMILINGFWLEMIGLDILEIFRSVFTLSIMWQLLFIIVVFNGKISFLIPGFSNRDLELDVFLCLCEVFF